MSIKILYVVGAGASNEVGVPVGQALKKTISQYLDSRFDHGNQLSGDRIITQAIRNHVNSTGEDGTNIHVYLKAGWKIRDGMPQARSIDEFIDAHRGNRKIELCGKLAIVCAILDAEKNSALYIDQSNIYNTIDFDGIEKTWYSSFLKVLVENCSKEELLERFKSIVLIVFNYDRCIEHFLYHAIQNYYEISNEEAGQLVSEIEIYHPYGVVGGLPWQAGETVPFGYDVDPSQLLKLVKQIKTFTEGTDEVASEIIAIRGSVSEAENIVFLGFAYNSLNMKMILGDRKKNDLGGVVNYYGTAHGISDYNCIRIQEEIESFSIMKAGELFINKDLRCVDLFHEYGRSLSLV